MARRLFPALTMRLIDRYVLREILLPLVIALLVFTFVLIIPFILGYAEEFIAKGVAWPIIAKLMALLVPAHVALTIPMALLLGILVAFGRLSGDREIVVMMACGISPYRLLRPIIALALLLAALDFWVLAAAIPDSNQQYRETLLQVVADRTEGQVRPRVFFEEFPGVVLYVNEVPQEGGWRGVFAADTRNPAQPVILLAKRGRMIINREAKTIEMVLEDGARHSTQSSATATYETARFEQLIVPLDPESVFRSQIPRGDRELRIPELEARIADLRAQGAPVHNAVMELHKKYSIPVACLIFALMGVALGVSNRRDGKLASFVLGVGVIFAYYIVMFTSEALAKGGQMPAWLAMWMPNIVLGAAGLALLAYRARGADRPLRIPLPSIPWRRAAPSTIEVTASTTGAGRAPQTSRPVLVIRFPQFDLPRPNLLDLYVGRLYVRILGVAVLGIMGLFYISTFIDMSDKVFKGTVTMGMIGEYMLWATPQFLYYIIAIAVLLAAIVTIGLLTKNSELIVMRACGISIYRTAVPLVVFAACASAVLFSFEERVLSISNRRADFLKHVIRGGDPRTFDVLNRKWLMGPDGDIYHYLYFDPRQREFNTLSVMRIDPDTQTLAERTFAANATYAPRAANDPEPWLARSGWTRQFKGSEVSAYAPFTERRFALESADTFVTEAPRPEHMTFAQLKRYIAELQASGYVVLDQQVALYRKFAFPLVTFVMTLIAVPFAVTTGKRGAMYGIGIGIILALVYWTANSVFAAFGAGGVITPVLAAWAPNVLFGAAAAYMLLTVRT